MIANVSFTVIVVPRPFAKPEAPYSTTKVVSDEVQLNVADESFTNKLAKTGAGHAGGGVTVSV
jgi:hypothetical protein